LSKGDNRFLLWWELTILHTINFMRGRGHMIGKCMRDISEDWLWLEEVHIILEEELHNISLHENET
jgi:hypothetical protein